MTALAVVSLMGMRAVGTAPAAIQGSCGSWYRTMGASFLR